MCKKQTIENLIIVPGHGIYLGNGNWSGTFLAPLYEERLLLEEHIRAGVNAAKNDSNALLIFSGGQTRDVPVSEAGSYYRWATENLDIDLLSGRLVLEQYSRDSFENLAFSIHRYFHFTNSWPKRISVYGYIFKKKRFVFHAETLKKEPVRFWLEKNFDFDFHYEGVNNPIDEILNCKIDADGKKIWGSRKWEEYTLKLFQSEKKVDQEGLATKRANRDIYCNGNPYFGDRRPINSYAYPPREEE